jgi:CDP-diacylglycerol---glycerol-3-phosphate 3-phosphatidyltransferase
MTWTSGVGRACGVLLDAIVRLLALSHINPNALTVMGLLVNTYAAFLFGYANGDNQRRMFFYAGLVVIGSGFFDLVDGRVARASNQVTRFGGFFDSVVDRYSDASLFFGLLVFYARGNRFLLRSANRAGHDQRHYGELRPRPRRIAHRQLPRRFHGTP